MNRGVFLVGAAWLLLAGPGALAQTSTDRETRDLIERLRPPGQQMRGLRMPAPDSGTVAPPADPAAPVLTPGARAPAMAQPDPQAPPVAARETTAPSGLAAVSITVNFASGSHALSSQAAAALTALGRALASPELVPFRFRIEGHTDTVGDADLNMVLSQRRANSVRDYLLKSFPIAPARLVALGLGEGQLLVPTSDNAAEPRNRRVQVVNLGG